MGVFRNITGQTFGRLLVLGFYRRSSSGSYWHCLCSCGNLVAVALSHLHNGGVQSCGCLRKEKFGQLQTTHGQSKTPEYRTWLLMKGRCQDVKNNRYYLYGGRGIKVCKRWLEAFENFFEDMGERPSRNHSIERVNNNGNYEPSNCRRATRQEQANNRRNNISITINNRTQSLKAWCNELNINYARARRRLKGARSAELVLLEASAK